MEPSSALSLPVICLRWRYVFPYSTARLDVNRPAAVKACVFAQTHKSHLFLIAQRDAQIEEPLPNQLFKVGVIAEIQAFARSRSGGCKLHLKARQRATWHHLENRDGMWLATLEPHTDDDFTNPTREALLAELAQAVNAYLHALPRQLRTSLATAKVTPDEARRHLTELTNYATQIRTDLQFENPSHRIDKLAQHLGLNLTESQALLEATQFNERIQRLIQLLAYRTGPTTFSSLPASPFPED